MFLGYVLFRQPGHVARELTVTTLTSSSRRWQRSARSSWWGAAKPVGMGSASASFVSPCSRPTLPRSLSRRRPRTARKWCAKHYRSGLSRLALKGRLSR